MFGEQQCATTAAAAADGGGGGGGDDVRLLLLLPTVMMMQGDWRKTLAKQHKSKSHKHGSKKSSKGSAADRGGGAYPTNSQVRPYVGAVRSNDACCGNVLHQHGCSRLLSLGVWLSVCQGEPAAAR